MTKITKKEYEEIPPVAMIKSSMRSFDIVSESDAPIWKKALGYMVIVTPYFLVLIAANELPRLVYWLLGVTI